MSVQTNTDISLNDRIRHKITWFRVPLMTIATLFVVGFMHSLKAFLIGIPVAYLGELIQIWAASQLHKDEHFTISGPYSYVRNPMYIGRFFLGLGFFIMTWNPYLIVGYVIIFAAYAQARVGREEKRLKVIFEPHYQHYCSEINRWLPKFKAYSKSESNNASWKQVCANDEQLNLYGMTVVLIVLYFKIGMCASWCASHLYTLSIFH